ncbi:MAG: Flp pilus assembly protein CpaB [Bryobacteraceae bacterium]
MKKNLIPLVSIAFVVAAVCTAVFYGLVAGRLSTPASASDNGTILVAARNLPGGQRISAADAKAVRTPAASVPAGAFRNPGDIEGLAAVREIAAGEPLTSARLVSSASGGGLGIPTGKRAISIQVADSSGVLSLLEPGHRVDVLAIQGEQRDAVARTVLRDIEVLRVQKQAEASPGKNALPVVTLLATPDEADQLALADAVARVRLLLRNPFDKEVGASAGNRLDVNTLMQGPRRNGASH